MGLAKRSMIIVGMQVQCVTWWREIRRPQSSRSQRGMITSVIPVKTGPSTPYKVPVMWNIGTTASPTDSALA